jgi:hypothetical protein
MKKTAMNIDLGPGYLPSFITEEVLPSLPTSSGNGIHYGLFRLAQKLSPWRSGSQIEAILRQYAGIVDRHVPEAEINDAIRDGLRYAWQRGSDRRDNWSTQEQQEHFAPIVQRRPPWPPPESEILADICRNGPSLAELRASSPVRCDENSPTTEEAIDLLFPGNPWLCCGLSVQVFKTRRREDWRGELDIQSLLVPSPMLCPFGFTQNGRVSAHAKSAVGVRKFLAVECDFAEKSRNGKQDTPLAPLIRILARDGISVFDMCAAVLAFASQFSPLAMIVDSGRRSLHGWFPCAGIKEEILHEFFTQCCRLGADHRTWLTSQFVRMPNGLRYFENGAQPRRQKVVFFNPEALSL